MKQIASYLILIIVLTACNSSGKEETEGSDLLAPQREAMERAEDVERVLDEAAERQRQLIEEQGG
ncbi:MAG: hypothetical protein V2J42_07870 [Wenzhouxiangella sp.]|jgi:hypothetical protein|nr:hypothetical protein [Wenzhouxiangella sp.]